MLAALVNQQEEDGVTELILQQFAIAMVIVERRSSGQKEIQQSPVNKLS